MYIASSDRHGLGQLGWFVKTLVSPAGHEVLTRQGAKGLPLTETQLAYLIEGVRRPDTASLKAHVAPGEQRRHVLRSTIVQSSVDALADAVGHLHALHRRVLAERDPAERFRLAGEALHLVQDSFAPAHVARTGGVGRVRYVRNYGPTNLLPGAITSVPVELIRQVTGATREHGFPADQRDSIYTGLFRKRLKAEAEAAILSTRAYLTMVLGHLRDRPAAAVVLRDLDAFVAQYLAM